MAHRLLTLLIAVSLSLTLSAQLEFDVASVKENKTLAGGGSLRLMPGGGITAVHVPAYSLISVAYDLKRWELIGTPAWANDTNYDVIAKPAGAATREQTFQMLQGMLVDRFKLTFHREPRELDGYALVQAKPGVLGPNLKVSTIDCEKNFSSSPRCREGGIAMGPGANSMRANGAPIWSLLQTVIGQVNAPVSDDTRLTGTFDFDLRWSNDVAPPDDLRSIYIALQEQLGLKLEKRHVSTDVFVVDRFERPTPD